MSLTKPHPDLPNLSELIVSNCANALPSTLPSFLSELTDKLETFRKVATVIEYELEDLWFPASPTKNVQRESAAKISRG